MRRNSVWASRAAALVAALMLVWPALAGWDEGLAAYQRHDWAKAAAEFRPLAKTGNSAAQARLGHLLFVGLGVPRDDVEALSLLRVAAEAGDPLAQHWLGTAYFLGRAVPRDMSTAMVWFSRAADAGFGESLHSLGEFYFNGIGLSKDEAKGVEYYRRAADKGIAASQEKLAELSWNGRAMPTDRAKALDYARPAAEAGRPAAQFLLGLALLTGDGTAKDPGGAARWFRQSAELGYAKSQHNLGVLLVSGTGVARNLTDGYFWLALAAERSPPELKALYDKERDAVGAKLPPAEVEAGRQKAAAWKPPAGGVATAATQPSANPAPESAQPKATAGSGFLVTRQGGVLTNAHVVEQCRTILVKLADRPAEVASVMAKDIVNDLALLGTNLRGEVARFREDRPLRSGDEVVVVGFPLSSLLSREANVTAGVVSALAGIHGDQRHYQITAPVQKGNSGGPLADMSGDVVGIVASKLNAMKIASQSGDLPQNINFAIKADVARSFMTANGAVFETAPAIEKLSAADVGERMKRITVFIECQQN